MLGWGLRLQTTAEQVPNIHRTVTEQLAPGGYAEKRLKGEAERFQRLPYGNRRLLCSTHSGVACHPLQSARSAVGRFWTAEHL
jgi:hypothetical protein